MKNNNLKIIFSFFWSVVKTSFDVCLAELWHLKIIHKWRHTKRGRRVDVDESFVMTLLGYLVDWLVKVGVLLLFKTRYLVNVYFIVNKHILMITYVTTHTHTHFDDHQSLTFSYALTLCSFPRHTAALFETGLVDKCVWLNAFQTKCFIHKSNVFIWRIFNE